MPIESNTQNPVHVTQALVKCPSVTPEEGGAITWLQGVLDAHGFNTKQLTFKTPETRNVTNLYARIGKGTPHLCFAGHTDVVPVGNEQSWSYPPFSAEIHNDILYGRGAVDMKGGIAAWVAATVQYLEQKQNQFKGSMSFIITGDEEGPAVNGTRKILKWCQENNQIPDHCLLGEPTCETKLGDAIKIGRRGSLTASLHIKGIQGHVAYPENASNSAEIIIKILKSIQKKPLDNGNQYFQPSTSAITAIECNSHAENIIPENAYAKFNIRYNTEHTHQSLSQYIHEICNKITNEKNAHYDIKFSDPTEPFICREDNFTNILKNTIKNTTGITPKLSTGGGTSDARFIRHYCPVLEFGLVNKTIHAIDERVDVKELQKLTRIYRAFIERYFTM